MSTSKNHPTRQRLVVAAGELFRLRGFAGTGIKAILQAADAPYGSLYHFFPGGKQELAVAVLDAGRTAYRDLIDVHFARDDDVVVLVREFFDGAADLLEQSDFVDACPIATLAGEVANTDELLRAASDAAFETWIDALATQLVGHGIGQVAADRLAPQGFCALEGAFLLARVTRNAQIVRDAGATFGDLVGSTSRLGVVRSSR